MSETVLDKPIVTGSLTGSLDRLGDRSVWVSMTLMTFERRDVRVNFLADLR